MNLTRVSKIKWYIYNLNVLIKTNFYCTYVRKHSIHESQYVVNKMMWQIAIDQENGLSEALEYLNR